MYNDNYMYICFVQLIFTYIIMCVYMINEKYQNLRPSALGNVPVLERALVAATGLDSAGLSGVLRCRDKLQRFNSWKVPNI